MSRNTKTLSPVELKNVANIYAKGKAGKVLTERETRLLERYEEIRDKPTAKEPLKEKKHSALREKQAAFVLEYLKDLNATQAAIRAGYCPRTADSQASRLLRKVKVAEAIRQAKAKRKKASGITNQWILTGIRKVINRCMVDGEFDASNALKGFELLGRHLGMWDGDGNNDQDKGRYTVVIQELPVKKSDDPV